MSRDVLDRNMAHIVEGIYNKEFNDLKSVAEKVLMGEFFAFKIELDLKTEVIEAYIIDPHTKYPRDDNTFIEHCQRLIDEAREYGLFTHGYKC